MMNKNIGFQSAHKLAEHLLKRFLTEGGFPSYSYDDDLKLVFSNQELLRDFAGFLVRELDAINETLLLEEMKADGSINIH